MSRAVLRDAFGGPEVLQVREVPEPNAGHGEIRVAVRAAGLNPMDWQIAGSARHAAMFGITGPSGFGCDLAGVVDEVGQGVTEFAPGDRMYGGVLVGAVADYVVLRVPLAPPNLLLRTPDGIDDATAAALPTPGLTAAAALDAVRVGPSDTVLIGGAAGGVGVLAVQLARLAGATVIGTASPGTFDFLKRLGAVPVTYGAGLAARVRAATAWTSSARQSSRTPRKPPSPRAVSSITRAACGCRATSSACSTRSRVANLRSWNNARSVRTAPATLGRSSSFPNGRNASSRNAIVTSRPNPALFTSTRLRTRSGASTDNRIATAPPSEFPATCTGRVSPTASRKSAANPASAASVCLPGNGSDIPRPARSTL